MPNDSATYGPWWAGKLLTADETTGTIYAVAPGGAYTGYRLTQYPGASGYISPDTLLLIPPNQDLYILDWTYQQVLKLPSSFLQPYVGAILAVQSGEPGESGGGAEGNQSALFIIQWNGTTQSFVVSTVPMHSFLYGDTLEKAAFAPH